MPQSSATQETKNSPLQRGGTEGDGVLPQGWQEVRLGDVIEVNPQIKNAKLKINDDLVKFVSMDKLNVFTRQITSYEVKKPTGTKFQNGDTLLARITPCLENGKTAFVDILEENEVGYGSTEFLVLREKANVSDKKFIYYLSISPKFRELAIKAMTGTSGRQRVQNSSLFGNTYLLPPLPEQKAIASILSSLDDKIELLRKQNQTLENLGQRLFEMEVVENGGDWENGKLEDIAEITSGKRPVDMTDKPTKTNKVPLVGATKIMGYVESYLFDEPVLVIGRVGTHGEIQKYYEKIWPSDNTLVIKSSNFEFVYFILKNIDYAQMNTGAVQPLITQTDLKNYPIIIPSQSQLEGFHNLVSPLFSKILANTQQIQTLSKIRDILLPELMSGRVRVS
jgi:type I restriction enzyme S subunit